MNTILSAKCSNYDFKSYLWPKLAFTVEGVPARISGPLLSDWGNFESSRDDGSKPATERANDIWKQLLRDYEQLPEGHRYQQIQLQSPRFCAVKDDFSTSLRQTWMTNRGYITRKFVGVEMSLFSNLPPTQSLGKFHRTMGGGKHASIFTLAHFS